MQAIQPSDPSVSTTLVACKRLLKEHYDDRLQSLILFGSAARQQVGADSDLDLLVVLNPPIDYFSELQTIVDLLYPLQLEASHWISAKPALYSEFEAGATQLYRNIQREGKIL